MHNRDESSRDWPAPSGATLELARELADMRLLQELSSELIAEPQIELLYDRIAAAGASLMRSDFASMQMLHSRRHGGELRLLAHRGFTPEAAESWQWVPYDNASSCGAAMRARHRIVIHDVEQSDLLTGTANLAAYRQAGIRAAQSTPLFARDGHLVGMLSTHWRHAHTPGERECALFDILARQAADLVQQREGEDRLREAHAVLEQRVAERTREVRDLLGRVVKGLEDERRRIARDIHDQAGQQLTALRMNIDLMASAPSSEQTARTQVLAEVLDRTIESLAWEMRPPELDRLGLTGALKSLVHEWSSRFELLADCDLSAMAGILFDGDIESSVYRIVQEALHNVSKHAHAQQVDVEFVRVRDGYVLTVRDNGTGFSATDSATAGRRLGLINMRERAALIGGTLAIETGPGGTSVRLSISPR